MTVKIQQVTALLLLSAWGGLASAQDQVSVESISTSGIEAIGDVSQVISCPHLKTRLIAEREGLSELLWMSDGSAKEAQLDEYFRHRFAADAVVLGAQRTATAWWVIPKSAFESTPQVYGISELGEQDFSGAQMHFEVAGRSVRGLTPLVVRSPVRMLDVCLKGSIELTVYSGCPEEKLAFWRPNDIKLNEDFIINTLQCRKTRTIRLSLAGVEAELEKNKIRLGRNSDRRSVAASSGPTRCDPQAVSAAGLMNALIGAKELHNCAIDVTKKKVDNNTEYTLYARDLFSCGRNAFDCLESEFSISIANNCLGSSGVAPQSETVIGVKRDTEYRAALLESQLNEAGQLMELEVSHLDLNTGVRSDQVICHPKLFGGKK